MIRWNSAFMALSAMPKVRRLASRPAKDSPEAFVFSVATERLERGAGGGGPRFAAELGQEAAYMRFYCLRERPRITPMLALVCCRIRLHDADRSCSAGRMDASGGAICARCSSNRTARSQAVPMCGRRRKVNS
jgi:hypothetical protein